MLRLGKLGVVIGITRFGADIRQKTPAYQGLQAWHHALGLVFAPFILAWIFSGFLSLGDNWPLRSPSHARFWTALVASAAADGRYRDALSLRPRLQPNRRRAGVAKGVDDGALA
jgi:hypothetical protein